MKATKKRGLLFLLVLISLFTLVSCTPKEPETVTLDIHVEPVETLKETMYVYFGNTRIGPLTADYHQYYSTKVKVTKDKPYAFGVNDIDSSEDLKDFVIVNADNDKSVTLWVHGDDFETERLEKVEGPAGEHPYISEIK